MSMRTAPTMVAVLRPGPGPVNANWPEDAATTWGEVVEVVFEEPVGGSVVVEMGACAGTAVVVVVDPIWLVVVVVGVSVVVVPASVVVVPASVVVVPASVVVVAASVVVVAASVVVVAASVVVVLGFVVVVGATTVVDVVFVVVVVVAGAAVVVDPSVVVVVGAWVVVGLADPAPAPAITGDTGDVVGAPETMPVATLLSG